VAAGASAPQALLCEPTRTSAIAPGAGDVAEPVSYAKDPLLLSEALEEFEALFVQRSGSLDLAGDLGRAPKVAEGARPKLERNGVDSLEKAWGSKTQFAG
jgi:hypothetical protein